MGTTPESELRDWLDRLAIQDLIHRYSDAVTRADYDQMIAVFAPDATWESPLMGLRFESAREFIDFQIQGSASLDVLFQTAHSPVVTLVDADTATATTTIHEVFRGTAINPSEMGDAGEAINLDHYGMYYDDVARLDGEWKFTHRHFAPFFAMPGGVAGDVVVPRPLIRPA